MSFRQITDPASEPLRPIAVMRLEPEDFASRFGIDFEEDPPTWTSRVPR
jgi:hypothetical protein